MATSSAGEAPRGVEFLYSLNRLHVATSRAQCLAVLVANPELVEVPLPDAVTDATRQCPDTLHGNGDSACLTVTGPKPWRSGYRGVSVVGNGLSRELRAQVRVACGRIAGIAAAIVEAHRLGVGEGHHEFPWTLAYQRKADHIFGSLPMWYEGYVAALFGRCAEIMDECSIPARLGPDWMIVTECLVSTRQSIMERLASADPDARPRTSTSGEPIERLETPPFTIRFDALAAMTTTAGAMRLEQAATAVRRYMEAPEPEFLNDRELELLKRLADGEAIADVASKMGYSERSIYRALASLWKKLGVTGRMQGVRRAALEGLLDTETPRETRQAVYASSRGPTPDPQVSL